jgi:hypothetical protein
MWFELGIKNKLSFISHSAKNVWLLKLSQENQRLFQQKAPIVPHFAYLLFAWILASKIGMFLYILMCQM